MAEILSIISVISFIAAIVFFASAMAIFFAFKIPGVIEDLSGRAARKSIAEMRLGNEQKIAVSRGMKNPKAQTAYKVPEVPRHTVQETDIMSDDKIGIYSTQSTTPLEKSNSYSSDAVTEMLEVSGKKRRRVEMTILDEVMYIHTEEQIL